MSVCYLPAPIFLPASFLAALLIGAEYALAQTASSDYIHWINVGPHGITYRKVFFTFARETTYTFASLI